MITVLIPVYNYNVTNLVKELYKQLIEENIDFEIICIDDCSSVFYSENLELTELKNVQFIQLPKNIGRSKIRNLLASKANYEWLLFLDSDVIPETNIFIKTYRNAIEAKGKVVLCGGILYEDKKPEKERFLRWAYGKKREEVDCKIREKNAYNFFLGSNFMVHKTVFNIVSFNENIVKYGYEDNLFVEDLRINNINLKQIENRVYHLGIEKNDVFLKKTQVALENLKVLNEQSFLNSECIKLLKVFNSVKIIRPIFYFIWKKYNKKMEGNLKSENPSMRLFDIYKLSYFCYINN